MVGWCAALVGLCAVASPAPAEFKVGAGKVSVTPEPSVFPYKPSDIPSLNTGPGERDIVGVHDPLFARALVMADGARRTALVLLDTTAVPQADAIGAAVARAIGTSPDNVLVAATHTHSVPLFSYAGGAASPREQREIARLRDGAVAAARAAAAALQPATLSFGRGQAWVNINNGEESGSRSGTDPTGPSDKTLFVLRFATRDGRPIALLLNYASHAEVMFRSVTRNGGYEVSGDLPGAVASELEGSSAAAPVVLFTAAAEADQLTLFKSLQRGGTLPGIDAGEAGWALLAAQARRVSESALAVLAAMPPGAPVDRLRLAKTSVTCPGQQIRLAPTGGVEAVLPKPPVAIPLAVLRLGSVVLAGVGGDVATAIGSSYKQQAGDAEAMMVSMAGPSVGYVFADASYAHPGHGLSKSLLAPGCAEPKIVGGLLDLERSTAR